MIYFDQESKTFYLESKDLTYAFRVHELGFLNHLYYGKRIAREDLEFGVYTNVRGHGTNLPGRGRVDTMDIFHNECSTFGRSDYRESTLSFFDSVGVRVGDLKYLSHEILDKKPQIKGMPSLRGSETLVVKLKDERMGAVVELHYTVYESIPVIARHIEVYNDSEKSFRLDRAFSFCVDYPDKNWETITLSGAHLRERQIERTKLSHGTFTVDSNRGVSSSQMNPFMALVRRNTNENQGEVYGFNFIYSGNFAFKAHIGQNDELRVVGGINDYDFSWEVKPKERFVTPEVAMVYSNEGLGGMSRAFHDLYREYLINERFVKKARPIVINNWEATYFNFDTEKLCNIIDSVVGTGIDTFVLDDGWFGVRNTDTTGLGDWFVNLEKLPNGLKPIIDHAHKNGLKFGLWFEPEMVNGDSDLYRTHPDWIIHADGLDSCTGRDQYVLDLTSEEVRDYIVDSISKILRENEIDDVKWDMNRSLTENYSAWLGQNSKEFAHRYVLGLYDICERIVNGFPHIFFEGCASGGCRFDPAMLYYFPQIWTSDDSDAYMRTIIQYGTSLCYPLSAQSCHVSVCPNHQCGRVTPFNARADIAHLGATGYELDTTKLSQDELAEIKMQIAKYKEMEELVLNGDLYRLNNPLEENLFAEMVVSKDKAKASITVMCPLCRPNSECIRIYPKGLDEKATYFVKEMNLTKTGGSLMNVGLIIWLPLGDFQTRTVTFKKV